MNNWTFIPIHTVHFGHLLRRASLAHWPVDCKGGCCRVVSTAFTPHLPALRLFANTARETAVRGEPLQLHQLLQQQILINTVGPGLRQSIFVSISARAHVQCMTSSLQLLTCTAMQLHVNSWNWKRNCWMLLNCRLSTLCCIDNPAHLVDNWRYT